MAIQRQCQNMASPERPASFPLPRGFQAHALQLGSGNKSRALSVSTLPEPNSPPASAVTTTGGKVPCLLQSLPSNIWTQTYLLEASTHWSQRNPPRPLRTGEFTCHQAPPVLPYSSSRYFKDSLHVMGFSSHACASCPHLNWSSLVYHHDRIQSPDLNIWHFTKCNSSWTNQIQFLKSRSPIF